MRFKRVYIVNFGHTTTPRLEKYPSGYRWASLKLAKRVEKIDKSIISQKDPLIEDPVRNKERTVELRYKLDKNFYEKVLNGRSIRIMEDREGVIWVIYELKWRKDTHKEYYDSPYHPSYDSSHTLSPK